MMSSARQLLLFCTAIFATYTLQAQITLVRADLPTANDTLRITSTDASGFNFEQTGPNFTWNFANISSGDQSVQEYKSSLQTPYALFFLGLTIFGLKVPDIGIGGFGLQDVYNFYLIDNSQYAVRGLGFKFQNVPLAASYSKNDRIFSLPLRYGDTDSNNFSVTVEIPGFGRYKSSGYRKYEVDGWGNATTPYGSFNCLRVKSFISSIDSITISIGGAPINIGIPNNRFEYAWYAKNEKEPILFVETRGLGSVFTPTRAYYRGFNRTVTGISNPIITTPVKAYPNPSRSGFMMDVPASFINGRMIVADAKGSIICSEQITHAPFYLSTSNWSSGTYVATFEQNGERGVARLIIPD
jgi:hypothetical protein